MCPYKIHLTKIGSDRWHCSYTPGSRGAFVAIEVTYDFLVVHINASQKSLGDKPKSVYIFLQTPHEVYTRQSYFLDYSCNKHPILTN